MSISTDNWVGNTVSSSVDSAVVEFTTQAVSGEVVISSTAIIYGEAGTELKVESIRASIVVGACSVDQVVTSEAEKTF